MAKRFILICMICLFGGLSTGCWSKRELNELAIVSAIGFDKADNGYLVTVQVLNPHEITSERTGEIVPVRIMSAPGKTVAEALGRLHLQSPRKIYLSHIRAVIIGEELAKEGISNILDFLSRNNELRTDFYTLIAKGEKAADVLSILTVLEEIPANKLFFALKTAEKLSAFLHPVRLFELINDLESMGKSPALTGVIQEGDIEKGSNLDNIRNSNPPAKIKLDNLAAFKGDKLAGWLSEEESIDYNNIMGYVKETYETIFLPEGDKITFGVKKTESKINSRIVGGKPEITVEYRAEADIADLEGKIDLTKTENITYIENCWKETIEKRMQKTVKRIQQELKSDIFGFGEVIHHQNVNVWKALKDRWDEEFVKLPVKITAVTRIKGLGTATKALEVDKE